MAMNGAESLIRTALAAGIDVCFANPGTTEMPLVAALDAVEGMRAVLGLFEGVCTGAADGYGRMADHPALTLTHLGPGFANGIANLHNARRAHSPVVNVIGDQATWHLAADAPLTSDIESLARPVSAWVRKSVSAAAVAGDTADAIAAAGGAPGQVATLIVPSDCQWNPADGPAAVSKIGAPVAVGSEAIGQSAALLGKHGAKAALFIGGQAMRSRGLKAAGRIAAKTGCRLICETFPARLERGGGLPAVEKLPYFPEQALELMAKVDAVVIAGAPSPVAFFGYPNVPSSLIPESCASTTLATPDQDVPGALKELAGALRRSARHLSCAAIREEFRASDRCAQCRHDRPRYRRAHARRLYLDGRGGDYRPAVFRGFGGITRAYLSGADGRRDRSGASVRHGSRRRLPRSQGNRFSSRWQRDVHRAVAMDAGARASQRHHADLQQPALSYPAGRTSPRRCY